MQVSICLNLFARFVSLGFLCNAILRIKQTIKQDGIDLPNYKMMALHVFAFALFLLSNIPEYYFYISQDFVHDFDHDNDNLNASFICHILYLVLSLIS